MTTTKTLEFVFGDSAAEQLHKQQCDRLLLKLSNYSSPLSKGDGDNKYSRTSTSGRPSK